MKVLDQAPAQPRLKERRGNQELRQHFMLAETLLAPLLGNPESHTGAAFYRAMHKLQTAFPDLSGNEIEALVAAVVRSVQTRAKGR